MRTGIGKTDFFLQELLLRVLNAQKKNILIIT